MKKNNQPLISVIIPLYNEQKQIAQKAINSIGAQTYTNLEIIAILDGHNALLESLLKKSQLIDKRIKVIINETNIGLANSLNKAIQLANGDYIARMDADDFSLPERLEKQYYFLCKNNLDLIGSNKIVVRKDKKTKSKSIPESPDRLKLVLQRKNIMTHPTFFGTRKLFTQVKYRNLKYSQDYDFICRAIESGYRIGNVDQYLLEYTAPTKINIQKKSYQAVARYEIKKAFRNNQLNKKNIIPTIEKKSKNKIFMSATKSNEQALLAREQKQYLNFVLKYTIGLALSHIYRSELKDIIIEKILKTSK